MIFDYILAQLDGELARWQRLRAIVAGLETPAAVAVALPKLALALLPADSLLPSRPKSRRQRTLVRHVPRLPKLQPRALTGVIPAGPVVVSAAELREQAAWSKPLPEAEAPVPAVDPETLLRELSQRWGTGAAN